MTNWEEIPPETSAVIDSSVLIAMGGPDNEKYRAFQRFVTHRELTVYLPSQVAQELGEAPDAYTFHRNRLQAAQASGWLKRGEIDYGDPTISRVIDRTRKRMVNISSKDVNEDDIENADTVIAGLAQQLTATTGAPVTVFVSDSVAQQAIQDVLSALAGEDAVLILEGRQFIKRLLEGQL